MPEVRRAKGFVRINRWGVPAVLFCLACLGSPLALHAQKAVGSIVGTVKDPSGAAIPDATVTIVNRGTGEHTVVHTSAAGDYIVSDLLPGFYDVVAEQQGFKQTKIENLELRVQQEARVDILLQVGQVTQTVEVTGQAALMQTEEASVGTVIDSNRVVNLPLNGRAFIQLAFLSAGVGVTAGNGLASTNRNTQNGDSAITVGGQREMSNVFLLDGTSNTDRNVNFFAINPSIDAIQEFKVLVNDYSAEFGWQAGGQINMVTKAGSNSLHGSGWGYFRNQAFDAKNFFAPSGPIAPFDRQQWGGTVGGHILRNKLFYFGDYEGLNQHKSQTALNPVPNAATREGDFSNYLNAAGTLIPIYDPSTTTVCPACPTGYSRTPFANNMIPTINPVAQKLLSYIDMPNTSTTGSFGEGFYLNQTPRYDRQEQTNDRIDYVLSSNDRLFGRYSFDKEYAAIPGAYSTQFTVAEPRVQNFTLSEAHSFGANKVNDFRIGFLRFRNFKSGSQYAFKQDIVQQVGITNDSMIVTDPSRWGVPNISTGLYSWGDGAFKSVDTQRNQDYEYLDTFSWVKGRHTFKFGADLMRDQLNDKTWGYATGGFNFVAGNYTSDPNNTSTTGSDFAQYLLGWGEDDQIPYGNPQLYMRRWEMGFYASDEFRATSHLTLTLGLRYEYIEPWVEKFNNFSMATYFGAFGGPNMAIVRADGYAYALGGSTTTPININPTTGLPCSGTCPTASRGIIDRDTKNFMPRFGFAYRPLGSEKWVIRGGAGLFYDLQIGNTIVDYARNWPQQTSIYTYSPGYPYIPSQSISTFITQPQGVVPVGGWGTLANFPRPHIVNYNLAIQRQLGSKTTITVQYMGSQSRKLNISVGSNNYIDNTDACKLYPSLCASNGGIVPQADRFVFPTAHTCCQTAFPFVNANYNAGAVVVERRVATGLRVLSTYTWSRSLDDGGDIRGAGSSDSEPNNWYAFVEGGWHGPSNFDQTSRFVSSWLYDLPFGHGKRFGGDASRLKDLAIGGWQVNGIWTVYSGLPMTVYGGGAVQSLIPNQLASPTVARGQRTRAEWFNPAVFSAPGVNDNYGTEPRNAIRAPGLNNWDLSFFKNFLVSEKYGTAQFRAEFFNAFNHTSFAFPGGTYPSGTLGAITGTLHDSREIQLAVRYEF